MLAWCRRVYIKLGARGTSKKIPHFFAFNGRLVVRPAERIHVVRAGVLFAWIAVMEVRDRNR